MDYSSITGPKDQINMFATVFVLEENKALRDLISMGLIRNGVMSSFSKTGRIVYPGAKMALDYLSSIIHTGWDSLEFIQRIKKDEASHNIPIIVLSSYGFEK